MARQPLARTAPLAAGQLALELPVAAPELPAIGIEPEWKEQQRLWGHSFHPMCSYLASFPASLVHALIARYSRPGDVVLDPFSGRGTTPLQACTEGRIGVGNDLNPFAHLLTAAKVDAPSPAEARTRLAALRVQWAARSADWEALAARVRAAEAGSAGAGSAPKVSPTRAGSAPNAGLAGAGSAPLVPPAESGLEPGVGGADVAGGEAVPAEVSVAFSVRTLAQLLAVRSFLRLDAPVDRFLAGALTGMLHGKSASYLTDLMPNQFSMAPRYVREFAGRTGFVAPERDVFGLLEAKVARLFRQPAPTTPGVALLGDARDVADRARAALRARGLPDRARLVVTSPPYLRVVKYGYYNWLRTWLLGFDAREIDASLDDAHHRAAYLGFLRDVLRGLRPALTDDAVVVLVIGDVETDRGRSIEGGVGLAERVWESAAAPEGYALAGVALDAITPGRKMTALWGDEAGRATKTDRLLVLGATEAGRRRALAGATLPVDWTWPPRRLRAI